MTILVATRNPDKVREIEAILRGLDVSLVSLERFPDAPAAVEDGLTVEENALKKARTVRDATGITALADDTGLEVDALGGAPGVYSARYAGEGAGYEANNRKLIAALDGVPDSERTARFRCVTALALSASDGETVHRRMRERGGEDPAAIQGTSRVDAFVAEGILEGRIAREKRGTGGFGYDPVFIPDGKSLTFAEMNLDEKNKISHRAIAFEKLKQFLSYYRQSDSTKRV